MVLKAKAASKTQPVQKTESQAVPESSAPSITKKDPRRSPARKKSPARSKSPARPRTRSPARTKSPSRKSPSRKSPSRTKKEVSPVRSSTPVVQPPKARTPIRRSPTRLVNKTVTKSAETYFTERVQRPRRTNLDVDTDSDSADVKPQRGRLRSLKVAVEKITSDGSEKSDTNINTFNMIKRISTRNQSREVERVVHVNTFDSVAKKLGEFSDEDETVQHRKSVSIERGNEFRQITEFGGVWGALILVLLVPLSGIALFATCNESHCSFSRPPSLANYLLPTTYFNLTATLSFVGYAALLAILCVVPFGGRKVTGLPAKQGKFSYVMNGFFSCVVLTAIAVGLEFKNIPITEFIIKHLLHIFVASYFTGLVLSIYAYIRSFYVTLSSLNAHSLGKKGIYGFFVGRELNPRLFGLLDLKMYIFRLGLISSILLNFTYLYKSLEWTKSETEGTFLKLNPTLAVLVVIQTIYHLDSLITEATFITTFEIQYEGFGYMTAVGYFIYPFMLTSITKYVANYNVQLLTWQLVLTSTMFLFGFILFRGSNNQKDAFRKNPYDPALSHLETIPTTKGKKLICSGFWGIVRHPNYLGDILMHIAFAIFAPHVPPVLNAIGIILLLIHRTVRDNARCKQKYGPAWDRYCNKVKYVLIPKVY